MYIRSVALLALDSTISPRKKGAGGFQLLVIKVFPTLTPRPTPGFWAPDCGPCRPL